MVTAPDARAVVESALRTLGLVPDEILVSRPDAECAWAMKRGSARALVALVTREITGHPAQHLRVVAPVVAFADEGSDVPREALFLRVLELNAAGLAACAFGVLGDSIVLVSERPTQDLDEGEVLYAIRQVAALADVFDDQLVASFGGRRSSDPEATASPPTA
ncbi:MAG: YbjN domain-containing protein [Myxococcales bacterium]|nr:YbjN domain-containing protein [Myxococcales bacterium]